MKILPVNRTRQRTFSLLLLPLCIFFASFPWLSSAITTAFMHQKAQQIEHYLNERGEQLHTMIHQQIAQLQFDCGAQDWQVIRDPQYYNRYIRFMGIITQEHQQCSTLGYPLDLHSLINIDHHSRGAFSLLATPVVADTESELLIKYTHAGHTAFWVLDSSWTQSKLNDPCIDCFYYEAHFLEQGQTMLLVQRGNNEIVTEPDARILEVAVNGIAAANTQHLWAGKALKQYIQHKLLLWGTPLSLLFGSLLIGGYWVIKNYRNSIEGLIEKGIRDNEFVPYYQPIIDARTQKVVGYEVLLRWQKGQELIAPDLFIYAAESTGLIIKITNQIIRQVLNDLTSLPKDHWVSINLVADHVEKQHLSKLLASLNWPRPEQLKFELTERIPIKDLPAASKEIAHLMKQGYQFKIDDFGTGYGGFSYLQHLHIRSIKIDKMFVDTIDTDDVKKAVLDSIIASAKAGNIELIAEGVETENQVNYLHQQGVYLIQGYFFAKAMPLQIIIEQHY